MEEGSGAQPRVGRALTVTRRVAVATIALVLAATLMPAPSATAGGDPWRPRPAAATRYLKSRQGQVSWAAINEKGRIWGHHRHRTVDSVSVIKAMLLATYLRMGSVRDRPLREWEKDLLGPMIKRSNNTAASRIRDMVGHRRINRLARDAGMRTFRVVQPWGLSQITAHDQVRFFYRYERFVPRRHEDYARYLLSHVLKSQRWGLSRFVDRRLKDWKIFFKGGWGFATGRYCHQVAWLEKRGRRIAVAILIEYSPSHRYATRTQQGVARKLMRNLR